MYFLVYVFILSLLNAFLTFNLLIITFLSSLTAKRPPVEETASFLQSLLASHGPNYLEKLFGSKARDALAPLGGVEKVAIALSESQTIEGKYERVIVYMKIYHPLHFYAVVFCLWKLNMVIFGHS